jgi:hypothetical protein
VESGLGITPSLGTIGGLGTTSDFDRTPDTGPESS